MTSIEPASSPSLEPASYPSQAAGGVEEADAAQPAQESGSAPAAAAGEAEAAQEATPDAFENKGDEQAKAAADQEKRFAERPEKPQQGAPGGEKKGRSRDIGGVPAGRKSSARSAAPKSAAAQGQNGKDILALLEQLIRKLLGQRQAAPAGAGAAAPGRPAEAGQQPAPAAPPAQANPATPAQQAQAASPAQAAGASPLDSFLTWLTGKAQSLQGADRDRFLNQPLQQLIGQYGKEAGLKPDQQRELLAALRSAMQESTPAAGPAAGAPAAPDRGAAGDQGAGATLQA
ncbi:MAG: hypothetical protein HYV63_09750 [Candidatus Schekmanbacteria bacterium]|nr:hypothetical protein [Candidatus Schekmanbacteria bacterium]